MVMTNKVQPGGKLEKMLAQMRALAERQKGTKAGETLTDDGPLSATRRGEIARDEAVVRQALALVKVDYDALIATEGDTPYAQAVRANPRVADEVLKAEQPVLAALKIALDYQPYAEFQAKYGREPSEIKERIAAELQPAAAAERQPKKPVAPVFASRRGSGGSVAAPANRKLQDVFGH
jgi:hypothetical protein